MNLTNDYNYYSGRKFGGEGRGEVGRRSQATAIGGKNFFFLSHSYRDHVTSTVLLLGDLFKQKEFTSSKHNLYI